MPIPCAIRSATTKPMPGTSRASRYGFSRTRAIAWSPYALRMRAAYASDTPRPCRNTITSRSCRRAAASLGRPLGAPLADALDLRGAPRLLLDHLDRFGAERADEPLGQHRADALEPLEIARHAAGRARDLDDCAAGAKLLAVGRMALPGALELELLARRRVRERADDADRLLAALDLQAQDGERPIRRGEDHAQDAAFECFGAAIANMKSLSAIRFGSCVLERKKMTTTVIPRLVLASASPRRLELLRQAGLDPEVMPPGHRRDAARRRGRHRLRAPVLAEKARAVANRWPPTGRSSRPIPSSTWRTARRASSASPRRRRRRARHARPPSGRAPRGRDRVHAPI